MIVQQMCGDIYIYIYIYIYRKSQTGGKLYTTGVSIIHQTGGKFSTNTKRAVRLFKLLKTMKIYDFSSKS